MALVRKRIEKKPTTGKIVPKKPKAPKEPKAEKVAKAKKPEASTSITVVERAPMAIATFQQTTPEAPAAGLGKSFINEARKLDEKIVKTIDRFSKDYITLGAAFDEMQRKGYHTALGFKRFEDYLAARWPDQGKTQAFQAMRIVRDLTSGPNPVATAEQISGMSRDNAEAVARLKKAGVQITSELLEDAKVMTAKKFQEEKVLTQLPELAQRAAAAQGSHLASAPIILIKRTVSLTSPTEAMRVKCFDIVRFLGDKTDPQDASFEDEAFATIFGHFIAEYGADYEAAIAAEESKQAANAQEHSDGMVNVTDSFEAELADEAADEETNDVANTAEASEDGEEKNQTAETVTAQTGDGFGVDFGMGEDFTGEHHSEAEGEVGSEESNEEHHHHEG